MWSNVASARVYAKQHPKRLNSCDFLACARRRGVDRGESGGWNYRLVVRGGSRFSRGDGDDLLDVRPEPELPDAFEEIVGRDIEKPSGLRDVPAGSAQSRQNGRTRRLDDRLLILGNI